MHSLNEIQWIYQNIFFRSLILDLYPLIESSVSPRLNLTSFLKMTSLTFPVSLWSSKLYFRFLVISKYYDLLKPVSTGKSNEWQKLNISYFSGSIWERSSTLRKVGVSDQDVLPYRQSCSSQPSGFFPEFSFWAPPPCGPGQRAWCWGGWPPTPIWEKEIIMSDLSSSFSLNLPDVVPGQSVLDHLRVWMQLVALTQPFTTSSTSTTFILPLLENLLLN